MAKFNSETARAAGAKGGRPRNDARNNGGTARPTDSTAAAAAAGQPAEPDPAPNKSGRRADSGPAGTAGRTGSTAGQTSGASLDLGAVAAALQMTHGLIAALTKQGHWQLTDQDARAYAAAVKNVARHYSIGVTQKALDFYALGMIMLNVEGSRMVASYQLARRRRREPPPPPPGMGEGAQVFEFRQPSPPPATSAAPPDAAPGNGMAAEGFTGDGIDGPIGGPAH